MDSLVFRELIRFFLENLFVNQTHIISPKAYFNSISRSIFL